MEIWEKSKKILFQKIKAKVDYMSIWHTKISPRLHFNDPADDQDRLGWNRRRPYYLGGT